MSKNKKKEEMKNQEERNDIIDAENPIVVDIKHLCKNYKMFTKKSDRLIEAIMPNTKRHTVFKALDDFSLEIKKGEVLGILGKNGAGKSTLLKIITGVVSSTSGNMKINGKISSLLELGAAFNSELTGEENIYQHGQVMGLTKQQIEEKKQEIIDFADIGDHLYQPVKTYSSGMFARLAFACAINVDPDILIVDEVLSVGDMAFQLKCFKKFEQLKSKNKTIIFVTHNIGDILKNCTRTIILNHGKKIFDGDVKPGVEKYKKMIVGIDEDKEEQKDNISNLQNVYAKSRIWKEHFNQNPNIIEYGNGDAEVIDYGIFNENGEYLNAIENDKITVLKSKIKFKNKVKDPIFTMTLKDFRGLEICGTNTLIEKIVTGTYENGDVVEVSFKQKFNVAPGQYTLSFSCTHFNNKGELEVLNRKYDALLVEVLSIKDTVGIICLDSDIDIKKLDK